MSKFVGTTPSSCKKKIYRATVSQRLRNTALDDVNFFVNVISYELSHSSFLFSEE
jgi:hypothetical protein